MLRKTLVVALLAPLLMAQGGKPAERPAFSPAQFTGSWSFDRPGRVSGRYFGSITVDPNGAIASVTTYDGGRVTQSGRLLVSGRQVIFAFESHDLPRERYTLDRFTCSLDSPQGLDRLRCVNNDGRGPGPAFLLLRQT